MPILFPFTAIVEQNRLKRALILNAVYPAIGGVLIRGERGTAKSTAARALGQLLPDIEVVADCPFSCDPDAPASLCSLCQERLARAGTLPRARRRVRLVELPVSATEDRVVGSLDIQRALQTGERHFEPGVLAAANRGIIYIDEVNLLDDHVVDLLLDAAAMGVNVVEREGISFSHPARFILIGTMNPEEGELRPQLLDRFALVVTIQSVTEPSARAEVLKRRLAYETDATAFYRQWVAEERRLAERIVQAQRRVGQVEYAERDVLAIADLTARLRLPGHRADLAILKTALAQAAFDGRPHITQTDIALAVELAVPHRLRQDPFPDAQLNHRDLEAQLAQVYKKYADPKVSDTAAHGTPMITPPSTSGVENGDAGDEGQAQPDEASPDQLPGPAPPVAGDRPVTPGAQFRPRRLTTSLDRLTRHMVGRRSLSRTTLKRGHYVSSRPAPDAAADLALDATLRAAAPYQRQRRRYPSPSPSAPSPPSLAGKEAGGLGSSPLSPEWERGPGGEGTIPLSPPSLAGKGAGGLGPPALRLHPSDLRRKVRTRRVGNLILFAVDASWSMAAAERMAATKSAVLSLLQDAYQRRDRVGLLVFRRDQAQLVLPFTNSVTRARRLLTDIAIGGKTPLAHGLWLAWQTFQAARRIHPHALPLLILLTDGVGNVAMTETLSPQAEIAWLAQQIKTAGIRSVVIDSEGAGPDSPAAHLARLLGGQLLAVSQLRAESIIQTVKTEEWPPS